jgi:hypothetical protein
MFEIHYTEEPHAEMLVSLFKKKFISFKTLQHLMTDKYLTRDDKKSSAAVR